METRKIKTISIRMIVDVRMPKPKKYANKIVLGNTGGYNGSQVSIYYHFCITLHISIYVAKKQNTQ